MGDMYSKNHLIAELSRAAGISRRRTMAVLDTLALIAYREAPKKFTVPGICRLDVIQRQARQARNPATGKILLIAAHSALRIRPLRKAKQAVAPTPTNLIQVLPANTVMPTPTQAPQPKSGVTTGAATPATPVAPEAPAAPVIADKYISFRCRNCSQEIEAPVDMAGLTSECPSCSNAIKIPFSSEPGTIWGGPLRETQTTAQAATPQQEIVRDAMKSRTIRIELPDDF